MPAVKFQVTTRPSHNFHTVRQNPKTQKRNVTCYQYLLLWWAESLDSIKTSLCRCVCACVWVICIVLFMFYELAVKKWDKSRGIFFHSARIKSGFYSKVASMTIANCNALSFREQKHLLFPTNALSYLSARFLFTTVIHKSPFYLVNS